MREIVFDTETTGLDPREDRVIEIGCVELIDRFPSGRTFHVYLDPQGRTIHPDAEAVHGLSNAKLAGKPVFNDVALDFASFIDGARLVAHNAMFDLGFINAEFARLNLPGIEPARIVDTLAIARRKHPMGPNSLDALCKRYGVDNSRRTKHGALLDSELLAEVYLELSGGRQAALGLAPVVQETAAARGQGMVRMITARPTPLAPRLSDAERHAHAAMVRDLGSAALWLRWEPAAAAVS